MGKNTESEKNADTLYVSAPVNALVEGIYRENRSLRKIAEQGDFGLGTFNHLDGEMVLLGGCFYQITGTGEVKKPEMSVRSPFACVTFFREMMQENLPQGISSLKELEEFINKTLPSRNMMYALWMDGDFEQVLVRSVPRQENYRPLKEVTRNQPVFEARGISGTLAGFYTPQFMSGINVPGVHLHFLSQDRQFGGHLLDCRAVGLRLGIQLLKRLKMDLPVSLDFMTADFQRDAESDMQEAEKLSYLFT